MSTSTDEMKKRSELEINDSSQKVPLTLLTILFLLIMVPVIYVRYAVDFTGRISIGIGGAPLTAVPIGGLFLLMFIFNPLLTRILKKRPFNESSIRLFYGMLILGGCMPTTLVRLLYSMGALQNASIQKPLLQPYLDNLSSIVIPKSDTAIMGFLRGDAQVPWGDWSMPIILWSIFSLAFLFMHLGLGNLFRRRWEEVERFRYPLAQPIIQMSSLDSGERKTISSFWRNKLMWCGFAVGGAFSLWVILQESFPGLPKIALYGGDWNWGSKVFAVLSRGIRWQDWRPGVTALAEVSIERWSIGPSITGITYFVPQDILFTAIVLVLIARPFTTYIMHQRAYLDYLTRQTNVWKPAAQGSAIALGIYSIWIMRGEIKRILMHIKAKKGEESLDTGEGLTYLTSICFIGISSVIILVFCVALLKIKAWVALSYIIGYGVLLIACTRIRVETGNPYIELLGPESFWRQEFFYGEKALGYQSWIGMNYFKNWEAGAVQGTMGTILETWKMTSNSGLDRRTVSKAMVISFVLVLAIFWITGLPAIYQVGAWRSKSVAAMTNLFSQQPKAFNRELAGPNVAHVQWLLISAALVVIVSFLHSRLMWFPFNPLGIALGLSNRHFQSNMGTYLPVYLAKLLLMRYGGTKFYSAAEPFFIGLIVGPGVVELLTTLIKLIATIEV